MITPRSRRFQFGLGTLLIAISVTAVGLYWPVRVQQAHRARERYEMLRTDLELEQVTTAEVCQASLDVYRAEIRVPFADHLRAADDHFDRLEKLWQRAYGPASEWLMGVANDAERAEAEARMEKVRRYYEDAARMAGIDL